MSRLFGELSGRRPGEGQAEAEEPDPKQERPAARIPQALAPDPAPQPRSPIETALRRELEKLRAELERQETLGSERDRILQEREDKFRSQAQELEAAVKRVAVLEDRQRQFTEKIRVTEGELAASRANEKEACEALEYERHLRSADAGRISDMEAEVAASRTRLAAMQDEKVGLARRLDSLERDSAGRVKLLQDELDGLRLREAASAKQGRDLAERLRVLEPVLQTAQAEAKSAREAQSASAEREAAVAARLSETESKLSEESALRAAAESGRSALSEKCAGLMKEAENANRAAVEAQERARELELRVVKVQAETEALRKMVTELEAAAAVRSASVAKEEAQPAAVAAGVASASAPAERRGRMTAVPSGAVVAVAAVLCIAAFLGGMLLRPRDSVVAVRAEPVRPVSGGKVAVPPVVPRPREPVEWPVLRVDGVQVRSEPELRTMVFEKGIFIKYTEIGLAARDTLRAMASQVKPYMGRLALEIEGHTDSEPIVGHPVYADNLALGKARAEAVLAFLRDDCGLPAVSMTATSAGGEMPPYPNDSAENRSRNRTVVLRLRPAL